MPFGLTDQGLLIKRLQDIKAEKENALRTLFGPQINLLPTSVFGVLVGVYAEREALFYEYMKGVYDAFYPDTSTGVNLDNVVSITGIKRLEATFSEGEGIAFGTLGTIIPLGSVISVIGNPSARYVTLFENIIGPGTNEIQTILFSLVPDDGFFTLVYNGQETVQIAFNANAAGVQVALNGLPGLSGVIVAGDFTVGFEVTFAGADGSIDQPLLLVNQNTLEALLVPVTINIAETLKGEPPNVTCLIRSETAGEVQGFASSITVIETPVPGWDSFTNPNDVDLGTNIETDAELRLRRLKTLATAGAATEEAILARILEIDEVDDCRVFSNRTLLVDMFGRPPKSFEAVVLGGDEQEIADTIWLTEPAGIESYGSITKTVVDTQGFDQTIKFSRPTQVPIYFQINLTVNANFPIDGDTAVAQAIATYGDINFGIGDDVLHWMFFCPIKAVQGIEDVEIFIGIAPGPISEANIPIADNEIAFFDTSLITVTVLP